MPPDPSLSCVVVAFHRPAPLAALLRALGPDVDSVVVNVDCDPHVSRVVAAAGAVEVPVAGNPGYGPAVNAGVQRATGELVAFMNDDIVIAPPALRTLAAVVAGGRAAVAVPRIVDGGGEVELTIAALPTPRALAREWLLLPDRPSRLRFGRGPVQKWRSPEHAEVIDAATAAVVVTARQTLFDHPLPAAYFLYWEESEWFWWLRQAGLRVMYEPAAVAVHAGGRADVRTAKSRLMARNAVRCIRRTQGRWAAARAYPIVVAWNARLVVTAAARRPAWLRARLAGLAAAVASITEVVPTGSRR